MNNGPSVVRRPAFDKSNIELINGLRSNFQASQQAAQDGTQAQHSNGTGRLEYSKWTLQDGDDLYIPSIDFAHSSLAEERSQYDITVKLFFLPGIPPSRRCQHTQDAIEFVLKELHVDSVDLLIVSLPNISFDADDEGEEETSDAASDADDVNTIIETWRTIERLHEQGTVKELGLAEFGSERLSKLLPATKVRPSVDQINVRDCCVVPKSLILYAKQEKIQLLTHNDCMDILPGGTTRELLGASEKGAGVLTNGDGSGLKGEVEPQWVVKYTAVVKDRGVIENKGYFAVAEMR